MGTKQQRVGPDHDIPNMDKEMIERARVAEAEDRAYFRSIPWTSRLMDDAAFDYIPMVSRLYNPTGEDAFLAETVHTHGTIPYMLALYRKPTAGEPVREVRVLMQLDAKLNGWPDVVHGGMQTFIMDEMMAFLLSVSKRVPGAKALGTNTVTAELKVRFIKTMLTPSVVCVTARLKDVKGRKCWTESTVTNEKGIVLASAEALFLTVKPGHHEQKL